MIDHDFGLGANGVIMAFDILTQLFRRLLGVKLRVVFGLGDQVVVGIDRGVILKHVEDEPFLDGLLHGVAVKGAMLNLPFRVGRKGFAEDFERLVFRRRGEGEITGVLQHFARLLAFLKRIVDRILGVGSFFIAGGVGAFDGGGIAAERLAHGRRSSAPLAGMGFVDDDGEVFRLFGRDFVQDVGEFLHRRDDDLFPLLDEAAKIP